MTCSIKCSCRDFSILANSRVRLKACSMSVLVMWFLRFSDLARPPGCTLRSYARDLGLYGQPKPRVHSVIYAIQTLIHAV
jgi:hypothetical protein